MGIPPPRVFWKKRLELLENTGFDFFGEGKEAASRWSGRGNLDRRDKRREALGKLTSASSTASTETVPHWITSFSAGTPMSTRVSSNPSIARERGVVRTSVCVTLGFAQVKKRIKK